MLTFVRSTHGDAVQMTDALDKLIVPAVYLCMFHSVASVSVSRSTHRMQVLCYLASDRMGTKTYSVAQHKACECFQLEGGWGTKHRPVDTAVGSLQLESHVMLTLIRQMHGFLLQSFHTDTFCLSCRYNLHSCAASCVYHTKFGGSWLCCSLWHLTCHLLSRFPLSCHSFTYSFTHAFAQSVKHSRTHLLSNTEEQSSPEQAGVLERACRAGHQSSHGAPSHTAAADAGWTGSAAASLSSRSILLLPRLMPLPSNCRHILWQFC